MTNRKLCLGMLVMALVFGMTVVGCDDGSTVSTGGDNTWTDVTSMYQLDGTWKATSTTNNNGDIPISETESVTVNEKSVTEITMTFKATSANTGTVSSSQKITSTFSGSDMSTKWPLMKKMIKRNFDERLEFYKDLSLTLSFDDSNYTITMTMLSPQQNISLSDLSFDSAIQIHQSGTKFRILIDDKESGEITETIFIKQ